MHPFAEFTLRPAQAADVPAVTALINSAYRGGSANGWTTEAHLLEGRRIDEPGLTKAMAEPDTVFLLCFDDSKTLIGSVQLQKVRDGVGYLGMFVIRPGLQGRGLGRWFMEQAEATARRLWGVTRMTMTVIGLRTELIAYYERCGYALTGEKLPFPFDGLSTALVKGIDLAVMQKDFVDAAATSA